MSSGIKNNMYGSQERPHTDQPGQSQYRCRLSCMDQRPQPAVSPEPGYGSMWHQCRTTSLLLVVRARHRRQAPSIAKAFLSHPSAI